VATPSQDFLDRALRDFAKDFVKNRTVDIIKQNLSAERNLLNSLKAQVLNQPERGVYMMLVAFNQYGRIQDMTKRSVSFKGAGGSDMIEWLVDWVEKKGVNSFTKGKHAAKYEGRSPERIKNMIAWGIVKSLRTKGKRKKRGWYNTGKERDIANFYDYLIKGYKEAITIELSNKLSTT